jgi:hypothetical protein
MVGDMEASNHDPVLVIPVWVDNSNAPSLVSAAAGVLWDFSPSMFRRHPPQSATSNVGSPRFRSQSSKADADDATLIERAELAAA